MSIRSIFRWTKRGLPLFALLLFPLVSEGAWPRPKILPYHFGRWTIPPRAYGYQLDNESPSYYGGINYRDYYNLSPFGRGVGYAWFPDSLPNNPPPRFNYQVPPFPWNQSMVWHDYIPEPACAKIIVHVPEDAEVWVDGHSSVQTGTSRIFQSPPLRPNSQFVYRTRARWKDGKGRREQFLDIPVRGGQQIVVRFPLQNNEFESSPLPRQETIPTVQTPENTGSIEPNLLPDILK